MHPFSNRFTLLSLSLFQETRAALLSISHSLSTSDYREPPVDPPTPPPAPPIAEGVENLRPPGKQRFPVVFCLVCFLPGIFWGVVFSKLFSCVCVFFSRGGGGGVSFFFFFVYVCMFFFLSTAVVSVVCVSCVCLYCCVGCVFPCFLCFCGFWFSRLLNREAWLECLPYRDIRDSVMISVR